MPIHQVRNLARQVSFGLLFLCISLFMVVAHAEAAPAALAPPDVEQAPATPTPGARTPLEDFEGAPLSWQVQSETTGAGTLQQSTLHAAGGVASARVSTSGSGQVAQLRIAYSDPASSHIWAERPGTWKWQQVSLYIPAATVSLLGSGEYLTIAGLWPSASTGYGWWLRVRQNGALYVYGFDADGVAREFNIYATVPVDRWFELELGLHSQNGPGVKRAFAFLVDGTFFGWYHQGRMANENYDRAGVGILGGNSPDAVEIFVDRWQSMTSDAFPAGPDLRPTANVQEQDYRKMSGAQWQVDWSTWGKDLRMDPVHGLYSANDRLQSGRNIDRMPNLTSGSAEIEIGWPRGTPSKQPSGYFGPMVGFRKEINREENFELIPIGAGGGLVNLVLEAWVPPGEALILAQWPLPTASIGGTQIPEPGDIMRVRWDQVSESQLRVRASFYDASAAIWYADVIDHTLDPRAVKGSGAAVNFNDGYHLASSITIDSPSYSIRRFSVGTGVDATPVAPTATAIPPTATAVPPTATLVPPTATPVPPTATLVPPTATAIPPTATAVPPTATPVPPTATTLPPTATAVPPTATPVPPTATAIPPTATAVPPTATPVPPTATTLPPTATAVPPTATPVPPTATAIPPTATATALPVMPFPASPILDDFSRSNGAMGNNWRGLTSNYGIRSKQLDPRRSGDIYWNAATFGPNQEAYVTLATPDSAGNELHLLLKVQGSSWSAGELEVHYSVPQRLIQIWTYAPGQEWVKHGADLPLELAKGDRLGARALASGVVEIYKNNMLAGARTVVDWPYMANGGAIGLWLINTSNALLDDFGGGSFAVAGSIEEIDPGAPAQLPQGPMHSGSAAGVLELNSLSPSVQVVIGDGALDPSATAELVYARDVAPPAGLARVGEAFAVYLAQSEGVDAEPLHAPLQLTVAPAPGESFANRRLFLLDGASRDWREVPDVQLLTSGALSTVITQSAVYVVVREPVLGDFKLYLPSIVR